MSINYFSVIPDENNPGPIAITETHPRWWGGLCLGLSQFFLDLAYAKARKVTRTDGDTGAAWPFPSPPPSTWHQQ